MSETAFADHADSCSQASRDTPAIPGKYLSITSFKSDGTGVATPVWFVQEAGRLLVQTGASSYKVRRIRRNARVTIAPCTATGRLRAEPVPARAELLPDAELSRVKELIGRKYRTDLLFIKPIRTLQAALRRGQPRAQEVALAISPVQARPDSSRISALGACAARVTWGAVRGQVGGLIIFKADSGEEAERLVANDPLIREDLLDRHWVKEWVVD